jgi:cell division protease FtsH
MADPNGDNGNRNQWQRNMALWAMIVLAVLVVGSLWRGGNTGQAPVDKIGYSTFLANVREGKVSDVVIEGNVITGKSGNSQFETVMPSYDLEIINRLQEKGVNFRAKPEQEGSLWRTLLVNLLPLLVIGGFIFFMMRQMQNSNGRGAMGFGKSRARMLNQNQNRVTFEDVAGIDEARAELEEIVDFLKDPQKFSRLGGKIPKGALLVGPPGTGKTLLARAIAGEANVPFFSISGSDFVEMFVGVGASRVRDMFEQAKKNAPCIIFIDEIDAVGRHRGAGWGGGNDEREQTLNQMLVEMDGFEANEGIIIIAATNRPDVLDPALLRPGRFDRQIIVSNPDINGREKILLVHMKKVPLAPDVRAKVIARGTPGFSGADLANLVNEAALLAARKGRRQVTMSEFEEAKDKVMMGAERRSMVMTEDEKKATAYHETGHALVSLFAEGNDPLHKVTIIPRGRALGVTWNLPERDKYTTTMKQMKARLALCFGGRIAEQLIYGEDELNTGAYSDIQQATSMARAMVTEFGMSEKLGWLNYRGNQQDDSNPFARSAQFGGETAKLIDQEVRRLVEEAESWARQILTDHLDDLHKVTAALLEYETLTGDEVKSLLRGETLTRPSENDELPPAPLPTSGSSIPKSGGRRGIGPAEPQPQG